MTTYCLKCKKKTVDKNLQIVTDSKTGKPRQKSTCGICGTKKSKFIKSNSKKGSGLLGDFLGIKIPLLGDIPIINKLF